MVYREGLGDEARQAQRAPPRQGCSRAQARGHSASHVDRRNRVQLVEEGGCRVTSKRDHRVPAERRGKKPPPGRKGGGECPDFLVASNTETALAKMIHPRRLSPPIGRQ